VHVEPRPDGSWAVVREGNKKASAVHETRERAEKHARSLARESGSEVYVHDRQDRVREHDSYVSMAQTHEETVRGEEAGSVLLTRPDTGAVERQVAYRNDGSRTWTVRVESYPPADESEPGVSTDFIGGSSMESEAFEELSGEELERRYPRLWEEIGTS
jgi:hypothetical protein